jgi:hypothetical protein
VALGAAYSTLATGATSPAVARANYEKSTQAYQRAAGLKPADTALQTSLAQAATAQAAAVEGQINDLVTQAQAASSQTSGVAQFLPKGVSPDPFMQAADNAISSQASNYYNQTTPLETTASAARKTALDAWLAVTKLTPKDPNAWFQMASAAAAANDTKNELAGYKTFLVLVPNDPLASPVKQQVDSLEGKTAPAPATTAPSSTATAPAGSSTGG